MYYDKSTLAEAENSLMAKLPPRVGESSPLPSPPEDSLAQKPVGLAIISVTKGTCLWQWEGSV